MILIMKFLKKSLFRVTYNKFILTFDNFFRNYFFKIVQLKYVLLKNLLNCVFNYLEEN